MMQAHTDQENKNNGSALVRDEDVPNDAAVEHADVAVIGGGPAGLQAALVLARTRKSVIVFDAPAPPRNGPSHGVHNFVGLDGMRPQEIRDQAWFQLDRYGSARLVREAVTAVRRTKTGIGFVVESEDCVWTAAHVVLTHGYRDRLPDIHGFRECWADTIIPCPFCDGFENRDRVWGIVPSMDHELDVFPAMVQNWTAKRIVIAPNHLDVTEEQLAMLRRLDVAFHRGDITAVRHDHGKLHGVTLDTGEHVAVETLLWTPDEEPAPLRHALVETLGLQLAEHGYIGVDEAQRTNVAGLWAAGDVQGWMGAIESATAGSMAATMIVHDWYSENKVTR